METTTYKVSSIEAWAGFEEGDWDINAWYPQYSFEIDGETTDTAIIQALIDNGYLKEDTQDKVYLTRLHNDLDTMVVHEAENHRPLYELNIEEGE